MIFPEIGKSSSGRRCNFRRGLLCRKETSRHLLSPPSIPQPLANMVRTSLSIPILALAAILATPALAQQGAPPYTTDNSQNACVEFGSCSTAGGNNVITATQNAPVTAPAGTPALATYTTLNSGFISSLAAAGASSAFAEMGGGSVSRAAPLTVTSTARGRTTATASGTGTGGGSSASGTMGLGALGTGSSNAGAKVGGDVRGKVVGVLVVGMGAVVGGVMLL